MRFIKGFGAVVFLLFLLLLAGGAFVVLTPVDASNIGSRLTLVCHGYRLAARHVYADRLDFAWARHVDCGCVLTNVETHGRLPAYAQFLERFRTASLENAEAALSGGEPTADPMADPSLQQVIGTLPLTIAVCQRFQT